MAISKLATYIKLSPNYTKMTDKVNKKITIHHVAGVTTAQALGDLFYKTSRQASSNYGIGNDGTIGCYVDEDNRSWCSSSRDNDSQAITIEVSNCKGEPNWEVGDKAMESLIKLCVDICKRNKIEKLNFTGDATGNLTLHKYFAATGCPGPYLESKMKWIADTVNKELKKDDADEEEVDGRMYRIQVGAFKNRKNAENYLEFVKSKGFTDAFISQVIL